MLGMAFSGMGRSSGEKRRRLDGDRRDYQRYLAAGAAAGAPGGRAAAHVHDVAPPRSATRCGASRAGTRLWERRPADDDFLAIRVGRGPQRLGVTLVAPETKPIEDLEPISAAALRRFVRTHSSVADLPAALALPAFGRLNLSGPPEQVRALVRAMLGQLAAFHSPTTSSSRSAPRRTPRRSGTGSSGCRTR